MNREDLYRFTSGNQLWRGKAPPNSPFPQQQQCYHSVSSFERNQSHDSGAVYRLFAGDLR